MAGSSEDQPPTSERKLDAKTLRSRPALPKLTRMKSDFNKILHEMIWSAHALLVSLFELLRLPLLCESNHLARFFNVSKQFPNSFLLA